MSSFIPGFLTGLPLLRASAGTPCLPAGSKRRIIRSNRLSGLLYHLISTHLPHTLQLFPIQPLPFRSTSVWKSESLSEWVNVAQSRTFCEER